MILTRVVTCLSLTLSTDVLMMATQYVCGRRGLRAARKVIGRTRVPELWRRHLPSLGVLGTE